MMPPINEYKCNKCDLILPRGWGGCMYVENDKGERLLCRHPGEEDFVFGILGKDAPKELVWERIGFNSDCICLDCLHQFLADLGVGGYIAMTIFDRYLRPQEPMNQGQKTEYPEYSSKKVKDKRECLKCKSEKVKTVKEMVGEPCPKCKDGVIEVIYSRLRC